MPNRGKIKILQKQEKQFTYKQNYNVSVGYNFDIFEITISNKNKVAFFTYKKCFNSKIFSSIGREDEIYEFIINDFEKGKIQLKENYTIIFSNNIILKLEKKDKTFDELKNLVINVMGENKKLVNEKNQYYNNKNNEQNFHEIEKQKIKLNNNEQNFHEIEKHKIKLNNNEQNFHEIKEQKIKLNNQDNFNTIKATYFIEKVDLDKEIKIIGLNLNPQKEDIINNCEIYLNNQQINPLYKFEKEGEYNITLNFKKELEDMSYLFYYCQQLKEIDLSNFKTQNAKNMKCMFSGCRKLIKGNFKKVNSNEVTDMKDMFSNCYYLKELDLSSFKTKKVKSMENMFKNCKSLERINVSSFDVSHVDTMECMFFNCEKLTQLNLSNFRNEDVKNISFMFTNCVNLQRLDFSNFICHNARHMSLFQGMNSHCEKIVQDPILVD